MWSRVYIINTFTVHLFNSITRCAVCSAYLIVTSRTNASCWNLSRAVVTVIHVTVCWSLSSKLHYFDLLLICCTTGCTTNPQHLDMSRCYEFVAVLHWIITCHKGHTRSSFWYQRKTCAITRPRNLHLVHVYKKLGHVSPLVIMGLITS